MHDGARPLVTCEDIDRAVDALAADRESWMGLCWLCPAATPSRWSTRTGWSSLPPTAHYLAGADPADLPLGRADGRLRADRRRSAPATPPTTPRWWRPGAAGWSWSRARPRTSRSPTGSTCATPSRSWRSAGVTDAARRPAGAAGSAGPAGPPRGAVGPRFAWAGLRRPSLRSRPRAGAGRGKIARARRPAGAQRRRRAGARGHGRAARGGRSGGHRPLLPRHRPGLRRRGQHGAAGCGRRPAARPGLAAGQRGRRGDLRRAAHRAAPGAHARAPGCRPRGRARRCGRAGYHHRGHGLHRPARGHRRPGGGSGREQRPRRIEATVD